MASYRLRSMAAAFCVVVLSQSNAIASNASTDPHRSVIRPSRGPATAAYTIHDVGAPSSATYKMTAPVSFNNTGQIAGFGINIAKGYVPDCIVFTGTAFVDITSAATIGQCLPSALNDATSKTSTFTVVGTSQGIFQQQAVGFAAHVNARTATVVYTPLNEYNPSSLYAINAAGTAIGTAYYSPPGGFFVFDALVTYATSSRKLAVLQPACTKSAQGCLVNVSGNCPFGGCEISNANQILGRDLVTNKYAIYSGGSVQELSLPASVQGFDLNGTGQLLYDSTDNNGNATPHILNLANGTTFTLPPLAGSSCTSYGASSMSNTGEVLGYATNCPTSSPFYFTWDATNGTLDLNAELPQTPDGIVPFGVNDKGQILVELQPPSGGIDWGTLDPIGSARHRVAAAKPLPARASRAIPRR